VPQALVELREYTLLPGRAASWSRVASDTMDLRMQNLPLRSFTLPESGGQLHIATHSYHYLGGHEEREAMRAKQAQLADWQAFLGQTREWTAAQKSTLWVEAPLVKEFGLHSMGKAECPGETSASASAIYELRRYQLKLGYSTVPTFLELYAGGLPSKLAAQGTDPSTSLVTVMYSETGILNEVLELWRHGAGTSAMERSRQASRGAAAWRQSIGSIAEIASSFNSTIHKPLVGAPWQ
jgi:hypothetical protein